MGNQDLDVKTNEPEIYQVNIYPASHLPKDLENLIIAPMLTTNKAGSKLMRWIDRDTYFNQYKSYIGLLRNRPGTKIKTAALDDGTVIGWCMYNGETVHYVFVKEEARRKGVCQFLLPRPFTKVTHMTEQGRYVWVAKYPYVKFDPWA